MKSMAFAFSKQSELYLESLLNEAKHYSQYVNNKNLLRTYAFIIHHDWYVKQKLAERRLKGYLEEHSSVHSFIYDESNVPNYNKTEIKKRLTMAEQSVSAANPVLNKALDSVRKVSKRQHLMHLRPSLDGKRKERSILSDINYTPLTPEEKQYLYRRADNLRSELGLNKGQLTKLNYRLNRLYKMKPSIPSDDRVIFVQYLKTCSNACSSLISHLGYK